MSNETKLTAVEWFHQQIVDRQNGNGDSKSLDKIYEQAKEMEKQHEINLIKFTKEIFELGKSHFSYAIITNEDILELYNETYGGNK